LLELTLQDLWVLNLYAGLLYGGISPDNGGFFMIYGAILADLFPAG
jgi:hypothetical protein